MGTESSVLLMEAASADVWARWERRGRKEERRVGDSRWSLRCERSHMGKYCHTQYVKCSVGTVCAMLGAGPVGLSDGVLCRREGECSYGR